MLNDNRQAVLFMMTIVGHYDYPLFLYNLSKSTLEDPPTAWRQPTPQPKEVTVDGDMISRTRMNDNNPNGRKRRRMCLKSGKQASSNSLHT